MNASNQMVVSNIIRYKARGAGTKNFNPDQFARLLVSVGKPYHEGAKLAAAVKWAKDNFKSQVILLGDTLQRYNRMLNGMDPVSALEESRQSGDEWLQRNASIIEGIQIFRWDEVLTHNGYMDARCKIGRLYYDYKVIKEDMDQAIEEVAVRWKVKDEDKSVFFDLSTQYLLEESAGKAVFNETYKGVSAYPGSSPSIWSLFSKLADYDVPEGLINDHTITLELRKAG